MCHPKKPQPPTTRTLPNSNVRFFADIMWFLFCRLGGMGVEWKGAGEVGGDNQVTRAGYGLDPNLALFFSSATSSTSFTSRWTLYVLFCNEHTCSMGQSNWRPVYLRYLLVTENICQNKTDRWKWRLTLIYLSIRILEETYCWTIPWASYPSFLWIDLRCHWIHTHIIYRKVYTVCFLCRLRIPKKDMTEYSYAHDFQLESHEVFSQSRWTPCPGK